MISTYFVIGLLLFLLTSCTGLAIIDSSTRTTYMQMVGAILVAYIINILGKH